MVRVTGKVIFPFWNRTLRFETPALTAIAAGSSCTSNDVSITWEDAPTFCSPARFNSRQPVFEWFLAFPHPFSLDHDRPAAPPTFRKPKPFSKTLLVTQYKPVGRPIFPK